MIYLFNIHHLILVVEGVQVYPRRCFFLISTFWDFILLNWLSTIITSLFGGNFSFCVFVTRQ